MKSIIIVSNQLQFINAVECLKYLHSEDNTLIIDCASDIRGEQFSKLLKLDLYAKVFRNIYYTSITKNQCVYIDLIYTKFLLFILTFIFRYEKVIIGNYNSLKHKYLISVGLKFNRNLEAIVVDDGTLSFFYPEIRAKEKVLCKSDRSFEYSRFIKYIYYNKFNNIVRSIITFYTLYNLKFSTSDYVIKNKFSYLSQNISSVVDGSIDINSYEKIIVAQPFLQFNALSRENYNKCINQIIGNTPKSKILYVAHPAETDYPDNFSELSIIKFALPFECLVRLINQNSVLYGFTSSVLINAKQLCPNMKIVAINLCSIFYKDSDFIQVSSKIYTSFKENGIEVIPCQ